MEWFDFWKIVVAAIGFGASGEAIRRYRAWKAERLGIAPVIRNSGFWTDRRIIRTEAVLASIVLAGPWSVIILMVSADRPIWVAVLALLTYPAAIYLIMRGLRAQLP